MKAKININQITDIVNAVKEIINTEEEKVGDDTYLEVNQKNKSVDNNFEITHRELIAIAFESSNNTDGKIKAYIIRNARLDCSLYFGSINDTCEATGVCRRTVIKVFNGLQEDDILRKYRDGVWAVNPKFLRRGSSGKYIGLVRFYNSLNKREKPKVEPKEEEPTALVTKLRVLSNNTKKENVE